MSEERFVDGGGASMSPWWGIHVSRYRFAFSLGLTGRVLDVACGSGYGTGLLVEHGLWAVGADSDPAAVGAARRMAPACRADGVALPFPAESFDAVISFETVEHVADAPAFIAELARVLRPEGLLILSTPNANYTRPVNGRPRNPHHVQEYAPAELRSLLRTHFRCPRLLGQDLGKHVRISPFLDDQRRLGHSPVNLARVCLWRVLHKSPGVARDRISRSLWGHSLYLTDQDYRFEAELVDEAPVLVAVAAPRR